MPLGNSQRLPSLHKLRVRRDIVEDPAFGEKLREEDPTVLSEIIVVLLKPVDIIFDSDSGACFNEKSSVCSIGHKVLK